MPFPVVVAGGAVLMRAAAAARAAYSKIRLPGAAGGWGSARGAVVARMRAMYDAVPGSAKAVLTAIGVGVGIDGVSDWVTASNAAERDDEAFAALLLNMANQGVDPDSLAPPEYIASLNDRRIHALFDNARAAYASYAAGNHVGAVSDQSGVEGQSSTIGDIEVLRALASYFGAHSVPAALEIHATLRAALALDARRLAAAGAVIQASGGRL